MEAKLSIMCQIPFKFVSNSFIILENIEQVRFFFFFFLMAKGQVGELLARYKIERLWT